MTQFLVLRLKMVRLSASANVNSKLWFTFYVYGNVQMANPFDRKTTTFAGFKAGISCSVTKKSKGMNMSAYVNRYKRLFLVEGNLDFSFIRLTKT